MVEWVGTKRKSTIFKGVGGFRFTLPTLRLLLKRLVENWNIFLRAYDECVYDKKGY
jgi:CRISPR/Cas system endoribonuclease Cas6 (RAMP superfamily)